MCVTLRKLISDNVPYYCERVCCLYVTKSYGSGEASEHQSTHRRLSTVRYIQCSVTHVPDPFHNITSF